MNHLKDFSQTHLFMQLCHKVCGSLYSNYKKKVEQFSDQCTTQTLAGNTDFLDRVKLHRFFFFLQQTASPPHYQLL